MEEVTPHFFISYSRGDFNRYLERFFSDLMESVAGLLDVSIDDVAFIDRANVLTGDDWNKKISRAAQVSNVLVCIYSPRYFSVNRSHEYCAKEFAAFLMRHDSLSYERYYDGKSHVVGITGVRNIIPILWYSEKELEESGGLPPAVVRTIQYSISGIASDIANTYMSKGMKEITRRRT